MSDAAHFHSAESVALGLIPQSVFDGAVSKTNLQEKARRAAELVLVNGCSQSDAAEIVGFRHRQRVFLAVEVVRKILRGKGHCAVCGGDLKQGGNPTEGLPRGQQ